MSLKLNLIAAACENMGIGKNNNLPWKLRSEMDYFTRMTEKTSDKNKKNIVIMGRRTWESIPPKFKPLSNRINFVLSRGTVNVADYKDVYCFNSLESALTRLKEESFKDRFEKIWVIGGSNIYKVSMDSPHFYRLYLTEIKKHFDCDTFMPPLKNNLKEVRDADVPVETQTENNIDFIYKVYENPDFTSTTE